MNDEKIKVRVTESGQTLEIQDVRLTRTDGSVGEVENPTKFPPAGEIEKIEEPIITATVITREDYLGGVLKLLDVKVPSASVSGSDSRTVLLGESRTAALGSRSAPTSAKSIEPAVIQSELSPSRSRLEIGSGSRRDRGSPGRPVTDPLE